MKWPLKCCLTFDDGFKTHATIAAPLLKKYGFKAAFNVPTEFMDPKTRKLTAEQIHDLCLEGNEDNLMTWDDVKRLRADGHEIFPHTLGHIDLLELEKAGRIDELRRQIVESKRQFIEHMGYAPKFFCSPHNNNSALITRIVRENGMDVFCCWRRNFPTHPNASRVSIADYLREQYRIGMPIVSVMMHGMDMSLGGWEPFANAADFELFLQSLRSVVNEGIVRIVPYSDAYLSNGRFRCLLQFHNRVLYRIRKMLIR